MTTESQSTTTKLEASEPPDRVRLVKRGGIFDGHWYYPDAAIMPFEAEFEYARVSANGVPTVDGISWSALLNVLERLRSKNRNPDNEWYHGWNAAIQCLINDINARTPAAASTVASQKSEPQYLTINGQRRMVIPCPDGIPDCEVLHTAPAAIAPSPVQAGPDDEQYDPDLDCLIAAVSEAAFECGEYDEGEAHSKKYDDLSKAVDNAIQHLKEYVNSARVAPLRTALDEIEVALISIADGVSPQEAVGKAFNIINHERSKLNAASSERCLSEGEA